MALARVLPAAFVVVAAAAAVGGCSGSFGSGTQGPVPLSSLQPAAVATTAPPTSSTLVVTYGSSTAFQELPEIRGYSGAIAFPVMPSPTPNPKSSTVPTAEPDSIGATLSIVKPQDGPDLNFVRGKGKHRKSRQLPARAVAYLELLPTHDATLPSYPRIAFDIPRELAAQYRDGEFGIALWNNGTKDTAYRLNAEERDVASTPPPIVRPSAVATAPPTATPAPSGSASPSAAPNLRPTPIAPKPSPTLPPQRLLFAGTATPLKLIANRPVIFALYALPGSGASPSPAASGSPRAAQAHASAAPAVSPSAPASASASAAPAASASPAAR